MNDFELVDYDEEALLAQADEIEEWFWRVSEHMDAYMNWCAAGNEPFDF